MHKNTNIYQHLLIMEVELARMRAGFVSPQTHGRFISLAIIIKVSSVLPWHGWNLHTSGVLKISLIFFISACSRAPHHHYAAGVSAFCVNRFKLKTNFLEKVTFKTHIRFSTHITFLPLTILKFEIIWLCTRHDV